MSIRTGAWRVPSVIAELPLPHSIRKGFPVEIDDLVREECWRDIRGLAEPARETVSNR